MKKINRGETRCLFKKLNNLIYLKIFVFCKHPSLLSQAVQDGLEDWNARTEALEKSLQRQLSSTEDTSEDKLTTRDMAPARCATVCESTLANYKWDFSSFLLLQICYKSFIVCHQSNWALIDSARSKDTADKSCQNYKDQMRWCLRMLSDKKRRSMGREGTRRSRCFSSDIYFTINIAININTMDNQVLFF